MGPPCGQRLPKRPSQNPRVFWALWAWRVVCVFWARGVQTQKHFRAQKKSKEVKGLLTSFGLGYYGRVEWSKDRVQTQKKWSKEEPLARFFRAPLGLLGLLGGVQTGPKPLTHRSQCHNQFYSKTRVRCNTGCGWSTFRVIGMIYKGERRLVGDGKPRRLPGALQCPSQSVHGEGLAQETREPHIPVQVHAHIQKADRKSVV
jgi:hypothetical protein